MSGIGKLAIELFKRDGYSLENEDATFERQNEYAKIARHVLDGMETCAKIAEDYAFDAPEGSEYRQACADIAEGIRRNPSISEIIRRR